MKTQTTMTPAPDVPGITTIPAPRLCPQQAGAALDAACAWLCEQRKGAPADADVWDLRFTWAQRRDRLLQTLLAGGYRLKPMQVIQKKQNDALALWGAQDALVLKWVALLIAPQLDLHEKCEHVQGHGGGPASVRRMADALRTHGYRFVCRTDIRGYYGNIRKDALLAQVQKQVPAPVLQDLIAQYVHYTVEDGGEFHTPERGISRGCALSPLMGALHLRVMDEHFAAQSNIYYARYMDDIVILTPTRWALRRQVKALNGFFNAGGFEQHPEKTFIGRTERGFDWMGAQMSDAGVEGIAHRARANYVERCRRLYGRVRGWPAAMRRARMAAYRKRWRIWSLGSSVRVILMAGLSGVYCNPTLAGDDVGSVPLMTSAIVSAVQENAGGAGRPDPRGASSGEMTMLNGTSPSSGPVTTINNANAKLHLTSLSPKLRFYLPIGADPAYEVLNASVNFTCNVSFGANDMGSGRTTTRVLSLSVHDVVPTKLPSGAYIVEGAAVSIPSSVFGFPADTNVAITLAALTSLPATSFGTSIAGSHWWAGGGNIVFTYSISCTSPLISVVIRSNNPNGGLTRLRPIPAGLPGISIVDDQDPDKGDSQASYGWVRYTSPGVSGGNDTIEFASMPACAWQNSPAGDPAYTFQDVTNAQYMQAGHVIETEASPIMVGISCDWGTSTGTVADALVTGWSPTALSTDGTEVAFTDDSLALQLLAPTSLPPGVRWATQQNGLGAPLIFGTSAATAKPLWTWDITSTSGKINPPPVPLTPRLMATKNALSAAYGKKTAQVTLILTTR